MEEVITIGLYGLEGKNWDVALREIDNVGKIYLAFKAAAEVRGKAAPKIVLSAYLIPDWKKRQYAQDVRNYHFLAKDGQYPEEIPLSKTDYITNKNAFLGALREKLSVTGLVGIVELEDFYEQTDEVEKIYLTDLISRGSNADIIKTHALIKCRDVKHLQLDTNTQITSYQRLYDATFGRNPALNRDPGVIINACCYVSDFVAAMNKIVYTVPGSSFITHLQGIHREYCSQHGRDGRDSREKTTANSIYSKDFVVALSRVGLTEEAIKKEHPIYLAINLTSEAFGITPHMLTIQHQSWRDKSALALLGDNPLVRLSKVGETISITCDDALCDFDGFQTLLRKYTDSLSAHGTNAEAIHQALMKISNVNAELHIIRSYFIELGKKLSSDQSLPLAKRLETMQSAIDLIPNTKYGNELIQGLFKCTRADFKEKPFDIIVPFLQTIASTVTTIDRVPSWISSRQKPKITVDPVIESATDEQEFKEIEQARESPGLF